MLSKRQIKLLKTLQSFNDYQDIKNISIVLGVSQRTVHNEIKVLKTNGIPIISKRGKGIKLIKQNIDYDYLLDFEIEGVLARRIEIIYNLIFEKKFITFLGLSEKYYTSTTSIKYDIAFIEEKICKDSKAILKSSRPGTKMIFSNTEQMIKVFLNFNDLILETLNNNQLDHIGEINLLKKYYTKEIVETCQNILYFFVQKNVNTISEIYVENFLKHLIIFIYLLKQDIHIDKVKCDDSPINDLELGYKDNASKLLQKLSQKLDFKYTNLDLKYLSLLLLNYRFEQLPNKKKTNKIIKDLIFYVSESMNVTLEDDEILFEQLQKHLPAMIFRLKFNILVKNPFTDKIKQDYPITYNILLNVVENLLKLKKLNPDEIAFLTLYFQLALEKKKVGHKILVLCKMGIITSEILVNRIKTVISTFDTVEVASITQLSDVDLSKYYLILSTVKIDQDLDNLYYISPLISYEKLTQLLKREKQETILKNKYQSIKKYLKEKLIFLDFEAENKEDFCLKIGTKLTKLKYVKDSFVHNLIQREALGSTDLAQGLAIPHGKVSDINKTFIALIKLSKKIKWQDYKVDLVIIIGISKTNIKESKLIISNIYEIIQDNHILEKIRKSKTGKEVIEIIYGS